MTNINEFAFLVSSDRSGSNLCLRLLGAHPEICAPPPAQLFPVLTKAILQYGDLANTENWIDFINDTSRLHEAGFGSWKHYTDKQSLAEGCHPRSLASVLKNIYRAEAKAHEKSRLFVKLHKAFNYADFLIENFPSAKYVHLVRDPRDMALSWKNAAGLRGGVVRAVNIWQAEQEGLLEFSHRMKDRLLRIRYEDLLTAPTEILQKVCAFLEIDYREEMMGFHLDERNKQNAQAIDAWRNLAQPLKSSNFGKYKKYLSKDECCYAELVCQKEMEQLGYPFEFSLDMFDLKAVEERLKPLEAWEKKEYANLSTQEHEDHQRLREAISYFENRV